eukprot:COSAG01_NODE_1890_length_8979_cov_5.337500_2_plen_1328_part_00
MVQRECDYVPGLYKIFDEILVNAADNKQRDPNMDSIKVEIDQAAGMISVQNNGRAVPVEMHAKEKVYVPELIFGHLLTGSNFDDDEKKVTGGRNGYGAKLANIFSTEFTVETCDGSRGKKYRQTFTNNMSEKGTPKITSVKVCDNTKKDYTKISFKPDLARMAGMTCLDADIVALMTKRVHDIAGTNPGVKVTLNGEKIPVKNFLDYVKLFLQKEGAPTMGALPLLHQRFNDRWEVVVSVSDGQFNQVSFVNSIATIRGGTHVNHVVDQLTKQLVEHITKKKKTPLKPFQVKNHLWVFVNCLIENPAFDSQTKVTMTSKASTFGSKCAVDDKFIKKVLKCGVVENIMDWAKLKQSAELRRKDGGKKANVNIPKLDDANHAGGRNGKDCTLILTEGDSAKALAISGLGVVGRDKFGVFPLRGKLLNVREAPHKQIMDNAEISAIKKILGLQSGKVYENANGLRYGHVMIMADQDHDGSHIKGLFINFIHTFWPSLLKVPGFMVEFITPIVKVSKGVSSQSFFTMPEYESWKEATSEERGWTTKYYKGLGTSTSKEAKEYFSAMEQHRLEFSYTGPEEDALIDMAFSKKKSDMRKDWLNAMDEGTYLDHTASHVTFGDFINKELILFSQADNIRSIPCIVDGFKPSQRKVLFSCFKRKLKKEIKVAQLAGYVSEHSAYHHGEASLQGTIINMAQTFCGSNNVNLLVPAGQFGTRLLGGKDAASPRYIFTCLDKITRMMFKEEDDELLAYLDDDGQPIEPKYYQPVVPLLLVNGSDGIGTGWSSFIPNYNPLDVISNVRKLLDGEGQEPMQPWYRGFDGTIERVGDQKFIVKGKIERVDETTLLISELPIQSWTNSYTDFLASMLETSKAGDLKIESYTNHASDTKVSYEVKLTAAMMELAEKLGLEKKFKIQTTITTSNMNVFTADGKIQKFDQPTDIIQSFFDQRLAVYGERKAHILQKVEHELKMLDNKTRFILAVVNEEFKVANRKRDELLANLEEDGYDAMDSKNADATDAEDEDEAEAAKKQTKKSKCGYDYLLKMPLWNLSKEKVEKLCAEREQKQEEFDQLQATTPADLWRSDLDDLESALAEQNTRMAEEEAEAAKIKAKSSKPAKKKPKKKTKTFKVSMDSDNDAPMDDSEDEDWGETKPKKKAAKPRAKAAAKAKAVPKPAPKPVEPEPEPEESEDEFGPSLAERMAARMGGASKPIELLDDDEPAAEPESKPTESGAVKRGKTPADTPEAKKRKPAAKKKAAAKKPAAKKVVKKQPKKKQPESDSDADISDVEDLEEVAPAPSRRPGRSRAKVNYAAMEEDSDDDADAPESDFDDDDF